ncbi:MAG TPA: MqnA/MqnD/SBP family protein, partial [Feifaniaceae bacterium]|nr:MqnA/MqnD/SBP family protein [Feifaniaceae bacterium]
AAPVAEAPETTVPEAATPAATATPVPTPAPEKAKLNVIALKGPTGMGMVRLMQLGEQEQTAADYTVALAAAPDEISGKLVTGEADIAAAPINLAAALYNKTGGKVKLIAVNTLGVLYILENGDSVHSVADLANVRLYATGQGATPEYVLNYLLEKNGVLGKVETSYMAEHAELAALLASGQGDVNVAMLPEPNATLSLLKNKELRVALDLTEEWNKVSGGVPLVQGCIVARAEVLEERPEAVAAFLTEYAASTAFTNEKPDEAAALIETYGILPSAAAAKAAIPNCNIVCVTGADMKASAKNMLQVLYDADPKSVGGKLPGDDFYYVP